MQHCPSDTRSSFSSDMDPLDQFSKLSIDSPRGCQQTIASLTALHQGLLNALQLAEQYAQNPPANSSPTATFQKITGCKRTEAMYYLQSAPNSDIRSAVIVWHSQVLRDYLQTYQRQLPTGISFKQHEIRETAEAMRAKARKAAAAAASFETNMAQNYLRTNFCSICKVERDAAESYMAATHYNLVAAVEEFIARHMLHPAEAQGDPDKGLHDQVLLSRSSSCGTDASGYAGSDITATSATRATANATEDGMPSGTLRSRFAAKR